MSTKKKPTMREELADLKALLFQMQNATEPPQELQFLTRLLYGAAARYGIVLPDKKGGVVSSIQIPILDMPEHHSIYWQELGNGTVMVQIVENQESPKEDVQGVNSLRIGEVAASIPTPADAGDTAVEGIGATEETTPSAPAEIVLGGATDPVGSAQDDFDEEVARSIEEVNG